MSQLPVKEERSYVNEICHWPIIVLFFSKQNSAYGEDMPPRMTFRSMKSSQSNHDTCITSTSFTYLPKQTREAIQRYVSTSSRFHKIYCPSSTRRIQTRMLMHPLGRDEPRFVCRVVVCDIWRCARQGPRKIGCGRYAVRL